jgi:uncharacterized protein
MPPKKKIDRKLPKRKRTQNKPSFFSKYFTVIASVVSAFLLGVLVGGYFYIDSKDFEVKVQQVQNLQSQIKEELSFEDKTKALNIEYAKDNDVQVKAPIKQEKKEPVFHYEEPDYGKVDEVEQDENSIVEKIVPKVKEKVSQIFTPKKDAVDTDKPRLAIIIDDVTTKSQIRKIKNIGYPVNVSLLPPTKRHPNSDIIANDIKFHMIHLPLQASSFKYEEDDTLHVGDSLARIEEKIASLKEIYPKAKYINNHTGSKFTANTEAMEKLFYALKKYDFYFIDSRTTAKSVARKLAKKHDLHMYSRDVFLDNNKDKQYIQNQLKQAIRKAKKNGLAIAIGHPYSITIEALRDSKHLLEGLELIYIDQL